MNKKIFLAVVLAIIFCFAGCAEDASKGNNGSASSDGTYDILGEADDKLTLKDDNKCEITVVSRSQEVNPPEESGLSGEYVLTYVSIFSGSYTKEGNNYDFDLNEALMRIDITGEKPEAFENYMLSQFEEGSETHGMYKDAFGDGYNASLGEEAQSVKATMTFDGKIFKPVVGEAYIGENLYAKAEYKDGIISLQTTYEEDGSIDVLETYNDDGNIIKKVYYTDGVPGQTINYAYDAKGNMTLMENYSAEGVLSQKKENVYDENGNKIKTSEYENGKLVSEQEFDSKGNITKNVYVNTEETCTTEYNIETGEFKEIILRNGSDKYEIRYYDANGSCYKTEEIPVE